MTPRFAVLLLAPLGVSCVEAAARPAVPTAPAVPIKSACTAGSRPASSLGIDVQKGRRHSDARTLFITNRSDRPRAVRVEQVDRVEGPCGGEWARQTSLDFADSATSAPPREGTLAPGAGIQVRVGPQRAQATWDCVKMGIALRLMVDGEAVCADAGAWIAEREASD